MSGAGSSPVGTAPYGVGTANVTTPLSGVPASDQYGVAQGSRFIDGRTRQYVYATSGRALGQSNVPHLVYMAFLTIDGTSAMATLGIAAPSGVIGNGFVAKRKQVIATALKPLVDQKLVEIVDIVIDAKSRPVTTVVRWKDLTTLIEQTATL